MARAAAISLVSRSCALQRAVMVDTGFGPPPEEMQRRMAGQHGGDLIAKVEHVEGGIVLASDGQRIFLVPDAHDGIGAEPGQEVIFDHVLLVQSNAGTKIGRPFVAGAKIAAGADRVAERAIKRRSVFCGIRHDGYAVEAGFVEFLTGSVVKSSIGNVFQFIAKDGVVVEVSQSSIDGDA